MLTSLIWWHLWVGSWYLQVPDLLLWRADVRLNHEWALAGSHWSYKQKHCVFKPLDTTNFFLDLLTLLEPAQVINHETVSSSSTYWPLLLLRKCRVRKGFFWCFGEVSGVQRNLKRLLYSAFPLTFAQEGWAYWEEKNRGPIIIILLHRNIYATMSTQYTYTYCAPKSLVVALWETGSLGLEFWIYLEKVSTEEILLWRSTCIWSI